MNEIIPILDKLAFLSFVVGTMFSTGLKLTLQQIWEPLHNIHLVILSLVENFLIVPLFIYLLLQVVPVTKPVKAGFIIMALASGPPALPKLAQIVNRNFVSNPPLLAFNLHIEIAGDQGRGFAAFITMKMMQFKL
ncbi:hypothetical protein [Nostoc sp. FACHB-133]|uniref:hypothetical protein n=1 Tax=Nostoc sp. FACHB-133 TaxID=2692835 RepID=UPI001F55094C|nr:hypothetical protein [Nostoc sp. FACHB-133]